MNKFLLVLLVGVVVLSVFLIDALILLEEKHENVLQLFSLQEKTNSIILENQEVMIDLITEGLEFQGEKVNVKLHGKGTFDITYPSSEGATHIIKRDKDEDKD